MVYVKYVSVCNKHEHETWRCRVLIKNWVFIDRKLCCVLKLTIELHSTHLKWCMTADRGWDSFVFCRLWGWSLKIGAQLSSHYQIRHCTTNAVVESIKEGDKAANCQQISIYNGHLKKITIKKRNREMEDGSFNHVMSVVIV